MKTHFPILLLLLLNLSQASYAQKNDQQEAEQALIKLFDALSARDAEALRSQCTIDARFLEYGQTWSVDTLINLAITKNTVADFKRTNKLDFVSTTVKGDVAWTTYTLHSEISTKDKKVDVYWLETAVLIREDRKWKVNVLHSTRTK